MSDAFWLVQRGTDGIPSNMVPIPADTVTPFDRGFLVPEEIHAQLLSAVIPMSNELLINRIDFNQRLSPEDIAARERERRAQRDAVTRTHTELLADASGGELAVEMLTMHAPHATDYRIICYGCDYDGYDGEPPAWPCTTYRAVAARHQRRFVDHQHGTRMERAE